MNFILIIVNLILGGFIGILIQSLYNNSKKVKYNKSRIKEIDQAFIDKVFSSKDLENLIVEWKTCIETQMHFNDLIIRFRSIVLIVFIAGLGFIYGITNQLKLELSTYSLIGLALVFWICCFVLDYFYYHKLLLGAVNHAKKFDENESLSKIGFFGMTKRINLEISSSMSKTLIGIFYLLPILAIVGLLILKKFEII